MSDERLVQLCAFGVAEQEYVVDVMRVRTILRPIPVTPVPHAPRYVEGVIELRGSVVPVVDLRRRLGRPVTPVGPKARMLIVAVGGREVALLVDRVLEVMRIPRAEIRAAPPLLALPGAATRFFLGVADAGQPGAPRLRLLLNVKALLETDEPVPAVAGGSA